MREYSTFIEDLKQNGDINAIEYTNGGYEPYISLQGLLKWISLPDNINIFSQGKPIVHIDWESDKPFFAYSTTISGNLDKCYVRNEYIKTTEGTISSQAYIITDSNYGLNKKYSKGYQPFRPFTSFNNKELQALQSSAESKAGNPLKYSIFPTVGNLNNVYLNLAYLLEELSKSSDNEENRVSISLFLQKICNTVTKCLGSVNDIQVVMEADTNTLSIIDYNQKRIKNLRNSSKQPTIIAAQGIGMNDTLTGTFVKNISAQSSITPQTATMISVGAQKQGAVLGEDATSFSKMSKGLLDRVYPTKYIDTPSKVLVNTTSKTRKDLIEERFKEAIEAYTELIKSQQPTAETGFTPIALIADDVGNFQNIPVELYKAATALFTDNNQVSTAFIPVKLDFTLYGISGIKIFQRFTLSSDVLPYSYDNNYDFLVTGVSHTVDNQKWDTRVSSLIALKESTEAQLPVAIHLFREESTAVNTSTVDYKTEWNRYKNTSTGTVNTSTLYENIPYLELKDTLKNYKFVNKIERVPATDKVNPKLLADLNSAGEKAGVIVFLTTVQENHAKLTKTGKPTRHWKGTGVDIAVLVEVLPDGKQSKKLYGTGGTNTTNVNKDFARLADELVKQLKILGYSLNTPESSLVDKAVLWRVSGNFGNHFNHLHVSNQT